MASGLGPKFPKISYDYWCNKNEFFANTPLIRTVAEGLNHVAKAGLVGPALSAANVKTNSGLVELIKSKIQLHSSLDRFDDEEMLLIFDLIQGWGGKMGRKPYCQPKEGPVRMTFKELPKIYRQAMKSCAAGDYHSALELMTSIKNVGESFATKHIFFWSEYGVLGRALPIYDARIKTLLFLSSSRATPYKDYVSALEKKAVELHMAPSLVERALFSFSQNYFPNDKLLLKAGVLDQTDIDVARELEIESLATKSKKIQS